MRRLRAVADLSLRSFEAFYAAEAASVHRAVAASLPDASRAADAVDEAMARACASWDRVGRYDAPAGWVYRVAINWATSRWRNLRRETSLGDLAPDIDHRRHDPDHPVGSPAPAALRELPEAQRQVVACRVLLDLDTRSTARALAIPEGTVKSRLARGLDALPTHPGDIVSTMENRDLDRDEVALALRREAAAQPVQLAPVGEVTAQARRRRGRRRASVAVVSAAAALAAGVVAVNTLADDAPTQVETAEGPAVEPGPGIEPLLVPGQAPASFDVPAGSADLDVLDGSGARSPWARADRGQGWRASGGIVLADGRRLAVGSRGDASGDDARWALLELDETGAVAATVPLPIDVPAEADLGTEVRIVGAAGPVVDLYVAHLSLGERRPDGGQSLNTEGSLVSVDVDSGLAETVLDGLRSNSPRTAGGKVVSVRRGVSWSELCLLDVRDRDALELVDTVAIACEQSEGSLPPAVALLALDQTGRYAAVERRTVVEEAAEISLVIVDLQSGTTTEVAARRNSAPWSPPVWDVGGTLRLPVPTDRPEDPDPEVEVHSPAGGPAVEVVRCTECSP